MAARLERGKVHWIFVLFVVLVVAFAAIALAPVVSAMRQPPGVRVAVQFMELLRQNKFDEAAKLLDPNIPKEKRDPKKAVEERMPFWGVIEKVSVVEVVESPADLKHPKAREGLRVDFHLQCYLAQGSAFVYVVPQDGKWVIADYLLQ